MAYRVCGIHTISEDFIKVRVACNDLIMLECGDQARKRVDGNTEAFHCVLEGDKNRMSGLAPIHGLQLGTPPSQQTETFVGVAHFVAQIVSPSTEAVNVVEILMQ